jgi:hypothetical protein
MAQQQKSYSGNVKDEAGLSLPGITVSVKGTKAATMTDNKALLKSVLHRPILRSYLPV